MRKYLNHIKRIEKELTESGGERGVNIQEVAKEIQEYMASDEPKQPITQKELEKLDPYLRNLYQKYMS